MMNVNNIINEIPNYIFWKDTNSIYLGCNVPFAKAAGLSSPNEVIGKTDFELAWRDTHAQLYRKGDHEVLCGKNQFAIIEPQLQSDNQIKTVLLNKIQMFNDKNELIGIIGSYIEVYGNTKKNYFQLTHQQENCLFYLIQGMTYKQIAKKMGLSWRTVQHYLEAVKNKLRCRNKYELIQKGLKFLTFKELERFK